MLAVIMLAATVSCGEVAPEEPVDTTTVGATDEMTTPSDTTTVGETDGPTTPPDTTTATPVPTPETKTFAASELGLTPTVIRGESDTVDISIEGDGSVKLTSKAAGSATFRIENNYSEAATLTVAVDDMLGLTTELESFKAPEKSVNVKNFGAKGNGVANDTEAIQRAIDSLTGGGTVYIPKGTYMVSYLVFRENIHIRLAGNLPDATVGYTDAVADYVKNGDVAILRRNGKNSHMFYNLNKRDYCTDGVSGIALSGGVLDCVTTGMAFVWACADGVLFENCIVKDISNNHAIQIDGCSNVTIRNIMFAGYTNGSALTRETIQIEPTTPGAISSNQDTTPVRCDAGDFHYNKNISITGCYFGKSDVSGPHQTPVGHHSSADEATCDGLEFSGNVVDNPLMYGLHLTNFVNVDIKDNLFISTAQTEKLADDTALISLYTRTGTVTYNDKNGVKITSSHKNEQIGNRDITISGNRFVLGGNTHLRVLYITGTSYKPGATVAGNINRVDEWGGVSYTYSGYIRSTNVIEDIEFSNNTVELTGATSYKNFLFRGSNVYGLSFENNTVPTDGYTESGACYWTNVTKAGTCTRVIDVKASAGKIVFVTKDGEVEYAVKASGVLTLKAEGGRRIDVAVGKNTVRITVDDPTDLEGWYNGEGAVDLSAGFSGNITLTAKFKG